MELKIKNFARIKEASIKLEGITVIAGENNKGKTTVGKILFASFNSLNNINKKVDKEINYSIKNLLTDFIRRLIFYSKRNIVELKRIHPLNIMVNNILNDIHSIKKEDNIEKIITDSIKKYINVNINDKYILENIKLISDKIKEYENILPKNLPYTLISDYYNELFYNQINSRVEKNTKAEIKIKDFGILFEFQNDRCLKFEKILYDNNAYFIYDPFILDRIDYYRKHYNNYEEYLQLIDRHLCLVFNAYRENEKADRTIAEKKLKNVYKKLSIAVNGKIIMKGNDFYLEFNNFTEPISIHNLSAGLKSFTIIKMMLEGGVLKENDILVLDEPEIHLHPKWQLLYAEIIVLIQKVFNLYIVITTHSPYFLEAIEIFTKHHGIKNKTNYYLADIKDNHSIIDLANDNISDIYYKMASPIEDLVDELGDN